LSFGLAPKRLAADFGVGDRQQRASVERLKGNSKIDSFALIGTGVKEEHIVLGFGEYLNGQRLGIEHTVPIVGADGIPGELLDPSLCLSMARHR